MSAGFNTPSHTLTKPTSAVGTSVLVVLVEYLPNNLKPSNPPLVVSVPLRVGPAESAM